jgi:hypothetical protein
MEITKPAINGWTVAYEPKRTEERQDGRGPLIACLCHYNTQLV